MIAVLVLAIDSYSGYVVNDDRTKGGTDGYALWYPSILKTIENKLPFSFPLLLSGIGVAIIAISHL